MKKVLIVEDEVAISKILKDELEIAGYEPLVAVDGGQGLDMALKHHPDLILLDIQMPVMDGLSVFKSLREDEWGKTARILLLTNSGKMEDIATASELNSVAYILKSDWDMPSILKKIKEMIPEDN